MSRLIELLQEFQRNYGDMEAVLTDSLPLGGEPPNSFTVGEVSSLLRIHRYYSEYTPPLEGGFRHGTMVCLIETTSL